MITITQTFKDVIEMHKFIIEYLKEYAPAGYGTTVDSIEFWQTYDEWKNEKYNYQVTISRGESCD